MPIYMQLGGVKGNVTNVNYQNWIEIKSIHWGVTVAVATTVGAGTSRLSSGKITPMDVSMHKEFDSASVPLLKLAFAGKSIPQALIAVTRTASNTATAYLTFTLSNVIISSFQTSGTDSSEALPMDSITLNFSKIELASSPTDAANNVTGNIVGSYDFVQAVGS